MLCENCGTVINSGEQTCRNCGQAPRRRSRAGRIAIIAVFALVVLAVGGFLIVDNFVLGPDEDFFEFVGGIFGADAPDNGTIAVPVPSPTTPPADGATTPPVVLDRAQMLNIALATAESYLRDNSRNTPFISRLGHLFNAQLEEFVTIDTLIAQGQLSADFADLNAQILYLRPGDLSIFEEMQIGNGNRMQIFLASPCITGINLVWGDGSGVIFRENLNWLFEGLNPEQGMIRRPSSHEQIFANALNAITFHTRGAFDDLVDRDDVRFLAINDNFAFASVSERMQSHIMRHYVLRRHGDFFEVIMTEFENIWHYIIEINNILPDFDFALLPDFDISRNTLMEGEVFDAIIQDIRSDEMIHEDEAVEFVSGNHEFVYLVFTDGQRFLAHFRHEFGWSHERIASHTDARAAMTRLNPNPPLYILRQE